MENKVTVLEKIDGPWLRAEALAISVATGAEVELLPKLPNRLVLINKPRKGSIEGVLSHTNYTFKEVEYRDRWL